jgi:nucleotide-binding universal stress UspA family protein
MQKILVALDHSERAMGVLTAALALATRGDARLVLVRATAVTGELPIEAYASDPEAIEEVLAARARDDLAELAKVAAPGLVASMRAEPGPAWKVIDRVAREEDVDLIVIGAQGYGAVERLLGTVAARVVNHADRSVLVVREPERVLPG